MKTESDEKVLFHFKDFKKAKWMITLLIALSIPVHILAIEINGRLKVMFLD